MISFTQKGDFKKANTFFEKLRETVHMGNLDKYGRQGVEALKRATPKDTGETANSWDYEIRRTDTEVKVVWTNSNINDGCNIAILIQYGHGNGNGAYISGRDYINPAMRSTFDDIAENMWKEVTKL